MASFRSRHAVAPLFALATFAALTTVAPLAPAATASDPLPVARLQLPPGFHAEVWAAEVPNARSLRLGAKGTVFVSSMRAGTVCAVVDQGGRRVVKVIAQGLTMPNGIEFHRGSLYVATPSAITRYDDIESRLDDPPAPVPVYGKLPGKTHHGWKYIRIGPDGKLYVPVGAPCNVCEVDEPFARILRMNLDGTGVETVARGVRNTVGFDFDPRDGSLWFTNNGRDWMGENQPEDTLHHVTKIGQHFGFPYCHQGKLPDPEFGAGKDCDDYAKPVALTGPHAGTLGMTFYGGSMFPSKYRGAIFIARHGSWNRKIKFGADLAVAWPDGKGGIARVEPFMTGLIEDNEYLGRPVDVLVLGDGSLLVSDDLNGAIYRIVYRGVPQGR